MLINVSLADAKYESYDSKGLTYARCLSGILTRFSFIEPSRNFCQWGCIPSNFDMEDFKNVSTLPNNN